MKKRTFILFLIAILSLTACQAAGPAAGGTETPTEASLLTAAEAEAIALEAAGVKAGEVTHLHTEFETDDGVKEYEVDFRVGDWEYDYTVHAETGAILSSDKEYDPPKTTDPAPTETQAPDATEVTTTEPPAVEYLSAEAAEDIALAHAGLDRADVRFERTEFDKDDGVPEYEIEFTADGWEYSYDIHAETGKILSSEKEYDD